MIVAGIATATAQITVKGVVFDDEMGEPLPGAAVQVVGDEQTGCTTDINGKFMLTVKDGSMLRFSFMGMVAKELPAREVMNVRLESENKAIDEVIVVAYGTAKKSAFTGSASVIKSDDIAKSTSTNALDALSGKVSGVQINNVSGQPGQTTPSILIRGISTVNAGTAPLIIVDGAPFEGDLNTIATSDIESQTVLKDAASAALYGARGANGVILITTKKGKRGQDGHITASAKWGVSSRQLPDYKTITSAAKHYELWYAGLANYGMDKLGMNAVEANLFANNNLTASNGYGLGYNIYSVPAGELMIGLNGKLNPNATLGNVITYNDKQYMLYGDNWSDAIYRNGLRQEYNITASNSTDRSTFFGSVSYLNSEGITHQSDYERLTGRLSADSQIKDWLKLSGNLSYSHYIGHYIASEGSSGDSGNLFSYTQMAPIYPIYIRDGMGNIIFDDQSGINSYDYGDGDIIGITRPYLSQSNPLSSNQLDLNQNEGNAFSATGSAEIRFLKDFKFSSVNSVNVDECRFNSTINPYFGQYASMGGIVSVSHVRTYNYSFQQLLNWNHTFGSHDIEIMLGHEYNRSRYFNLAANASKQFYAQNPEIAGTTVSGSSNSYTTDYNIEGWFARAQYNYDMRYFGSVSLRRDGTSRLHPDNRWGNFFSIGGAWLVTKESWWKAKWVDELKFKASYGEQGNDNIGAYRYTNIWLIGNSSNKTAILSSTVAGNENIKWEKNSNFNTGIEFSLWKGRLTGSIEYFYRLSSDLLYPVPRTPSWGYLSKYYNVGDMSNSGIEIELQGDIIRRRDLTWSARINLTSYRNRLSSIPDNLCSDTCDGVRGYANGSYFMGEGLSMYTVYMPTYAGVDATTGEALYWQTVTNADGTVSEVKTNDYSVATYHLQGSTLPDVYGGFGTSLRWKGLDVSFDFNYQIGGQVYDATYAKQMSFSRGQIFHADMLNAWTPTNTGSNIPRIQFNDQYASAMSSRFLTDASYLSLQNINIGYTFDIKRHWKGMQSVRVFLSADNVWVWSKRQGMDPRQSVAGSSNGEVYAPVRTISGGITIEL